MYGLSWHRHRLFRFVGTGAWLFTQACLLLGLPWWHSDDCALRLCALRCFRGHNIDACCT